MSKINRTPNYSAWRYVDKREDFIGSNTRGENYSPGCAPYSSGGTWLNLHERTMYERHRANITYVVWSFYTPIAYYIDGVGWYKVGQVFSSFSSRHASGALRNVPGHTVTLTGKRGNWIVDCLDCETVRYFTRKCDAEQATWCHR